MIEKDLKKEKLLMKNNILQFSHKVINDILEYKETAFNKTNNGISFRIFIEIEIEFRLGNNNLIMEVYHCVITRKKILFCIVDNEELFNNIEYIYENYDDIKELGRLKKLNKMLTFAE